MNCQIFETVVNDLAREQMIEANTREEALAHSRECEACALRLVLERRLTFGLRALAAEMKSESASTRVSENLLDAFRKQTSAVQHTPLVSPKRWWVAAAAVVLIALGIAGVRWGIDGPPQTGIEASNNNEGQSSAEAPSVATVKPTSESAPKQTALDPPRGKRSVRRTQKASSSNSDLLVAKGKSEPVMAGNDTETITEQSEVTTQFLPLSYVSPTNLQDGGQLVRVELPRSAMARFGLPVNMERYSERVKADVFVSSDGLARAIRFVQ